MKQLISQEPHDGEALSGLKVGDTMRAEFETATAVQITRTGADLK
jgi:hypothetical protein